MLQAVVAFRHIGESTASLLLPKFVLSSCFLFSFLVVMGKSCQRALQHKNYEFYNGGGLLEMTDLDLCFYYFFVVGCMVNLGIAIVQ